MPSAIISVLHTTTPPTTPTITVIIMLGIMGGGVMAEGYDSECITWGMDTGGAKGGMRVL